MTKPSPKKHSFFEMMFYKIDRTFSIIGIVVLGIVALYLSTESSLQVASICAGALAAYIGGKAK